MSLDIYGLKTCATCRKALRTLDGAHVRYDFHDVRDEGVTAVKLGRWAKAVGADRLLNRSSTTWRALPDSQKRDLDDEDKIRLMSERPTLIRRPIIERDGTQVYVGWSKEVEEQVTGPS
jgi:arsenate reductase